MKKHITFTQIVPGLILLALIALIAYQLIFLTQSFEIPAISMPSRSKTISADDLMAYRWHAMAEGYKQAGLLNSRFSAADLTAYRWNAMAQAYEQLSLLNYHDNPDDLLAYRWNAMAHAYQKWGMLNTP